GSLAPARHRLAGGGAAPAAAGRPPGTASRGRCDPAAGRGRARRRGARPAGRVGVAARGSPAMAPLTRNALVRLLAARGWTDVELATRAGVDRTHVNQIKNGRATPTVATALALARALELPVATVFPAGSGDWRVRTHRR